MAAGGCARNAPDPERPVVTVFGHVRIAGSTPLEQVLIEPEDSASRTVEVSGDYRGELRRLSGARVRAEGRLSAAPIASRLTVTGYEILEISGQKPVVGLLERRNGEVVLRRSEGAPVTLVGAPDSLRQQEGAMVWVVLDSEGAVRGYGVIRER